MKLLSTLLLAAALTALPTSCKSNDDASKSSSAASIPCRCGTQLGDLEGCAHPTCVAGKTNPDNPDCVCGQLEIPSGKK